jgi:hypothetical protein
MEESIFLNRELKMLNLSDREWESFYIKEIFPEIQRGKRLKNNDHKIGILPYISSSYINNGVDDFISNDKGVRFFSNCLTIANSGSVGIAFYHRYRFVASDHVTQLKNIKFNQYIYRFMAPLLSRLGEKYSFNREINDVRLRREKIILPVTGDGEPDWQFMEDYVKEREAKLIDQYFAFRERERERDYRNATSRRKRVAGILLVRYFLHQPRKTPHKEGNPARRPTFHRSVRPQQWHY